VEGKYSHSIDFINPQIGPMGLSCFNDGIRTTAAAFGNGKVDATHLPCCRSVVITWAIILITGCSLDEAFRLLRASLGELVPERC
jgi:hypothetical protein